MIPQHKKLLDEWWETEPFGWDHPDTYEGIVKVIEEIMDQQKIGLFDLEIANTEIHLLRKFLNEKNLTYIFEAWEGK